MFENKKKDRGLQAALDFITSQQRVIRELDPSDSKVSRAECALDRLRVSLRELGSF